MQMDFSPPRALGGRKRNRIFALHPSYAKAEHYSASGKEGGRGKKLPVKVRVIMMGSRICVRGRFPGLEIELILEATAEMRK